MRNRVMTSLNNSNNIPFEARSLVEILRWRAIHQPDKSAYVFLRDGETEQESITYDELDRRARAVAALLQSRLQKGDRVLLLYPPGLDFIAAFLGSLYAATIAVPAYPPDPSRVERSLLRIKAILNDARPLLVLSTSKLLRVTKSFLSKHEEIAFADSIPTDELPLDLAGQWSEPAISGNDIAFLQYTSGSTSAPKGVMVGQGNLIHNERMIQQACALDQHSDFVSWLPLYHDMGLIGGVLQPLYLGSQCVLMSPTAFLEKPVRWLRAISRYGAHTSGGPNFAFDLCVRKVPAEERAALDLSKWRVAFNGAEPLRDKTMESFAAAFAPCGFRAESFFPCYGLAEATLIVSGNAKRSTKPVFHSFNRKALEQNKADTTIDRIGNSRLVVSSGQPLLDQRVIVVDPDSLKELSNGQVGEIWVAGPSVARGYWNRPVETDLTFNARLSNTKEGPFLRTGDAGFFRDGELFITGRLKDLIIIRGRNHYPEDIELVVEESNRALRSGCGAAFTIESPDGEELVLVNEVDTRREVDFSSTFDRMRQVVSEHHDLSVYAIGLIKPGTIPKTSSGKIQRHACRAAFLEGRLEIVAEWNATAKSIFEQQQFLESQAFDPRTARHWLLSQISHRLGIDPAAIDVDEPITRYGLDSLIAIEIAHKIEASTGVSLPMSLLLQGISIAEITKYIAEQLASSGHVLASHADKKSEGLIEYPLSYGQKALWFLQSLAPQSAAYNISAAVRLQSDIDVPAFRRAWQRLINSHPALRVSFEQREGGLVQRVRENVEAPFLEQDASKWSEDELQSRLAEEASRPFSLTNDSLLRLVLFKLPAKDHVLLFVIHHIIADFWSLGNLVHELGAAYPDEIEGRSANVPPSDIYYSDFVQREIDWLATSEAQQSRDYWLDQLKGHASSMLNLPFDFQRPAVQSFRGSSVRFKLEPDLTEKLHSLSQSHETTLYTTLLAAFQVLLHRYTGQENILIGSPATGRSKAEFASVMGYFVNTIVLRGDFSGVSTFSDYLRAQRYAVLDAIDHQDYPFPLLVEHLQPMREPSRPPIFQVMFALQKSHLPGQESLALFALKESAAEINLGSLRLESVAFEQQTSQFDLMLMMVDAGDSLHGCLQYDSALFDAATVARIRSNFESLLEGIVEDPNQKLSELPLLSLVEQYQLLVAWNDTRIDCPSGQCLHTLFQSQVEQSPYTIALAAGDQQVSYRELNRRANKLAHYLKKLGVKPESIVGIYLERAPDLIVSMLAVLKAGGVYLPLDITYPAGRVTMLIEDANATAVLTKTSLAGRLNGVNTRTVYLDQESANIGAEQESDLGVEVIDENLAYVIYTSGSTGKPKGVGITHRNAVSLINWGKQQYSDEEMSAVAATTSICFDLSIFEIFLPLSRGGKVVLFEDALAIGRGDASDELRLINTVPSAMWELVRTGQLPESVMTVNLAGEALHRILVEEVYRHENIKKVYNLYGPSEDTTYSTFALVGKGEQAAPSIGHPVSNTRTYLVDKNLELTPIGATGEICIAGEGLARAYLNRPDLTAEKFVPNPFARREGERLYRTGDQGRYLSDGSLSFLGRRDHMVKVRGYRIELGEIESLICQHPTVSEAVVVVREDSLDDKRLIAYVVGKNGSQPQTDDLFKHLRDKIPGYMVPSVIVALDALPLTPNGKIDREALPAPQIRSNDQEEKTRIVGNPIQDIIAGVWAQVLGLSEVSVRENFFEIGGHSLLATQVISRLVKSFQIEIPLTTIFEAPTVEELSGRVETLMGTYRKPSIPSALPQHPGGRRPLSFAQQRLWFLDQLSGGSAFYNMPGAIHMTGSLNIIALEQALSEIARRHEVLRTNFLSEEGELVQVIVPPAHVSVPVVDLSSLSLSDSENEADRIAIEESHLPFDLEKGPVLRLALIKLSEERHTLLVNVHHIAFDGWSMPVFMREFTALYEAHSTGRPSQLSELPVQYSDFALWQRQWIEGERLESHLSYWKKQLEAIPPTFDLPADKVRPNVESHLGGRESLPINRELYASLKELSLREGATLYMALLAVFKILLHRYTERDDIIVGSPAANRNWMEVEGLIGFFSNMLVLRTDLKGRPNFLEVLARVREVALGAYLHQDLPFEKLVEVLEPERNTNRAPLFQIMFVHNAPMPEAEAGGVKLSCEEIYNGTSKLDLTLSIEETGQGPVATFEYSEDLFNASTVSTMLKCYLTLIEGIAANPRIPINEIPLLTDSERHRLLVECNDTKSDFARGRCIHQLFEDQVDRTPDHTAIIHNHVSMDYRALNRRANRLANHLKRLKVGPEIAVAICLERSPEVVVAMLAVLKAGGTYVPLDPGYPRERLEHILKDSTTAVLITQTGLLDELPDLPCEVLLLDELQPALAESSDENPVSDVVADNAAYIIYTSGSTGQPKGVVIQHRSLVNYIEAAASLFDIQPQDRILQFASLSFDTSAEEIYPCLIRGAALVLRTQTMHASVPDFLQKCADWSITVLNFPTAYWHELAAVMEEQKLDLPEAVRLVIVGGEKVLAERLTDWRKRVGPSVRFLNGYGPTEATIVATFWEMTGSSEEIEKLTEAPIGRPIRNVQAYVLDKYLQPVPTGLPGELYVGGMGLARGYLNYPEMSAEKFLPNPFDREPGARLYKTGDLVRLLPSGLIEYVGRGDNQVKIRGYRVELKEIESALRQMPGIKDAVVLQREYGAGNHRLIAFCVPHTGADFSSDKLRNFLKESLPDYMIPAAFVSINALPLMPNGKVDLQSLSALEPLSRDAKESFVRPITELQKTIAAIWQEVLKVDSIGLDDNFFDLGGHSLLLPKIHGRLNKAFNKDLALIDLFRYPTVRALAESLGAQTADPASNSPVLVEIEKAPITNRRSDIAIIGLAGRFPGARDVAELWNNLRDGVESISFLSADELKAAGVDPYVIANPDYVRAGALLDGVDLFDAPFFGYNGREAEIMDPQHRLFLECAWESLEAAGYDPALYPGAISVYGGAGGNDYFVRMYSNPDLMRSMTGYQIAIGNDKDHLATRVSYKLNLTGPSVAVQTACSTSLVAVHMACKGLLNGECDMALAGGVSITNLRNEGYLYQEEGILSPDGHCRAFDANARGTVPGNGVGIVVLKRLEDALTDEDFIYAVIKGSAINNDGSLKIGYTAPGIEGQAKVIKAAQKAAGIDPRTISYIETHGTGTALGDPIEVQALTQAFRSSTTEKSFCAIGSVKTNLGHLDSAAGAVGLIKVALSLKHKMIPPSLNYEEPNPKIDFENSPFYVSDKLSEWKAQEGPRRAAVSSFGLGGTNAHIIVEEAPPRGDSSESKPWQFIALSARTPAALETASARLANFLRENPDLKLADLCYTLQVGRKRFAYRRVVVCQDVEEAIKGLEARSGETILTARRDADASPVVFMFPGGGTQYANMGFELYQSEAVFRQWVDKAAGIVKQKVEIDIRDFIFPESSQARWASEKLEELPIMLPAIFAIEYALAKLLMSWGIVPHAMIGHSLGEYTAACLANVFSFEDALSIILTRASLLASLPDGAMLSINCPEAQIRELIDERLSLAAVNGPSTCAVSGPAEAIDDLASLLAGKGIDFRALHLRGGGHRKEIDLVLDEFLKEVSKIQINPPTTPYISNVTGTWIKPEEATNPLYWAKHLRQTVLFADGISLLLQDSDQVFLEVGPGQAMTSLAKLQADREGAQWIIPLMGHPYQTQSNYYHLIAALGRFWAGGGTIDWASFYSDERRHRMPLPTYPFERNRYWVSSNNQALTEGDQGWALAKKSDVADWFYVPSWKRLAPAVSSKSLKDEKESWVIFLDECGVGVELAHMIERQGREVIKVSRGDHFTRIDEYAYSIDPRQPDDYYELMSRLRTNNGWPKTFVYLWAVNERDDSEPTRELFEEYRSQSFDNLILLLKTFAALDVQESLNLIVISSDLHEVTGEDSQRPERALLSGLCKVIPQEFPNLTCRNLDVALSRSGELAKGIINQLFAEITSDAPQPCVAYRAGYRWAQSYETVRLEVTEESQSRLRKQGVYLITGGLGDVGLLLSEYLASEYEAKLVLVGRSEFPERKDWEEYLSTHDEDDSTARKIRRLLAIECRGSELAVMRADVADLYDMRIVVDEVIKRFGVMHGVIHAAGHTGEKGVKLISETEPFDSESHFQSKVYGLYVLEQALKGLDLDFCLLCSSLASVLGGLGSACYSAANAFMDSYSNRKRKEGINWISVNWDGWLSGDGDRIISSMQSSLDQFAMKPSEGMSAFKRIADSRSLSQVVVSTGNLNSRLDLYSRKREQAGYENLIGDKAPALHSRPEMKADYVPPTNEVEQAVADIWSEVLGIKPIGINDSFFELGGHSLLAIQVISRIKEGIGVKLPLRSLFENPTLKALADRVGEQMLAELQGITDDEAKRLLSIDAFRGQSTSASGSD